MGSIRIKISNLEVTGIPIPRRGSVEACLDADDITKFIIHLCNSKTKIVQYLFGN